MGHRHPYTPETGSALAYALLFLLVLTIITFGSTNSARLHTLLTTNSLQQMTAFSIAEHTLATAERDYLALADDPFGDGTDAGPYHAQPLPLPANRDRRDVPHAIVQYPDVDRDGSDTDGDGIDDDGIGEYHVEDGGTWILPGEDASVGGMLRPLAGALARTAIFTAHAEPGTGAAATLRSIVITNQWQP